jgi:hypothetical protein
MPERLSIATAARALAKLAVSCGPTVYSFSTGNKTIDQDFQQLHAECDSLRINIHIPRAQTVR